MSAKQTTRINAKIRAPEVRLIDLEGKQVGIVPIRQALLEAEQAACDLVEIQPHAEPPVCRLMDYGQYRYDQKKRRAQQSKKQKVIQVKEVKFRPNTDIGDYNVKLKKINAFLEKGKVKVSVRFRGREMQHRNLGMELLERICGDLEGVTVDQPAKLEGRQIMMVLSRAS